MSDSIDDVEAEHKAGQADPAADKPKRGGARPGAGRKPRRVIPMGEGVERPATADADPYLTEALAELGGVQGTKDAIGMAAGACYIAAAGIDPATGQPNSLPSPTELHAMTVTGNKLSEKYIGQADKYLSLEGLFALVWFGVLLKAWLSRPKAITNADPADPGSRPVGNGKDDAGARAGSVGRPNPSP